MRSRAVVVVIQRGTPPDSSPQLEAQHTCILKVRRLEPLFHKILGNPGLEPGISCFTGRALSTRPKGHFGFLGYKSRGPFFLSVRSRTARIGFLPCAWIHGLGFWLQEISRSCIQEPGAGTCANGCPCSVPGKQAPQGEIVTPVLAGLPTSGGEIPRLRTFANLVPWSLSPWLLQLQGALSRACTNLPLVRWAPHSLRLSTHCLLCARKTGSRGYGM